MTRRQSFRPSVSCELETRVVLSHVGRSPSVLTSGLNGAAQVGRSSQASITALVDQAYASFASDYAQTRSLYYSSFTMPAYAAFQNYTAQRVDVLTEQLVSTLLVSPTSTTRVRGQVDALPNLINRRVNGGSSTSLLSALKASIPPPGSVSSAATTLYSLSQDNAIEASRISVINGVSILKNGDFGNSSKRH